MDQKTNYFDEEEAPASDHLLAIAKLQGYVPRGCLLVGQVVMGLVNRGEDPCSGCNSDRAKCAGRPRKKDY